MCLFEEKATSDKVKNRKYYLASRDSSRDVKWRKQMRVASIYVVFTAISILWRPIRLTS